MDFLTETVADLKFKEGHIKMMPYTELNSIKYKETPLVSSSSRSRKRTTIMRGRVVKVITIQNTTNLASPQQTRQQQFGKFKF